MLSIGRVWNQKKGKGGAFFVKSHETPPFLPPSVVTPYPGEPDSPSLCTLSSSSSPSTNMAMKARETSISPQPNSKSLTFNLPHQQMNLWCEFGQKFKGLCHVFGGIGGESKYECIAWAWPLNLASTFFESSINWEQIYSFKHLAQPRTSEGSLGRIGVCLAWV